MKNYTFSFKKFKERNEKIKVKTSNAFLRMKMVFFSPENDGNGNSVDLVVSFL
jgi:hypothetical protein